MAGPSVDTRRFRIAVYASTECGNVSKRVLTKTCIASPVLAVRPNDSCLRLYNWQYLHLLTLLLPSLLAELNLTRAEVGIGGSRCTFLARATLLMQGSIDMYLNAIHPILISLGQRTPNCSNDRDYSFFESSGRNRLQSNTGRLTSLKIFPLSPKTVESGSITSHGLTVGKWVVGQRVKQ